MRTVPGVLYIHTYPQLVPLTLNAKPHRVAYISQHLLDSTSSITVVDVAELQTNKTVYR